ncbi:translational GTPase TypA, partial [Enterococcus faecalis]
MKNFGVTKILGMFGLQRVVIDEAKAGDFIGGSCMVFIFGGVKVFVVLKKQSITIINNVVPNLH